MLEKTKRDVLELPFKSCRKKPRREEDLWNSLSLEARMRKRDEGEEVLWEMKVT